MWGETAQGWRKYHWKIVEQTQWWEEFMFPPAKVHRDYNTGAALGRVLRKACLSSGD